MKKSLSLLLAALLLPLVLGAQMLAPNQIIIGHYTTDSLSTKGWGKTFLNGNNIVATDLTPEELAIAQGSQIKAFRVGLSSATDVSRVFVIPVYADGTFGTETSWTCNVSSEGWNVIELETPYLIDLPDDAKLRIGFDYLQDGTKATPLSVVKVGNVHTTYHLRGGKWTNFGVNTVGNLSLQLIVENDNFPQYILRARKLILTKTNVKTGDAIPFTFETCNLGAAPVEAGAATYVVAIDGHEVATVTNPQTLTGTYTSISGAVSTAGLTAGEHTLTVTLASIYGEPLDEPIVLSATFKNFDFGFTRQMRLVEQFTSTYCTHCPKGVATLQALSDLRGDIAWVGVHQNMSGTDVFRTEQCDTIADLQLCNGYPEASFDRSAGVEDANSVCAVISYTNYAEGATFFSNFLESVSQLPSWASVNINSTYDPETRQAAITIDGGLVPNYEDFMGSDSKLTVYITEDNLVSPQYSSGSWDNNFVHNGVLRLALGSAKGVDLKRNGDAYKNEFTVNIPEEWKADDLNIIAFISRPLGNPVKDIYVTNANKRKLGESDQPVIVAGDLNGDGEIDVADVSALIACVLNSNAAGYDIAAIDVDGDGQCDVSDVSLLINIILGK